MPVIMVSTLTKEGADVTLKALEMGAVDYLAKPSDFNIYKNLDALKEELSTKIRSAAGANLRGSHTPIDKKVINFISSNNTAKKIIAIGASTGGVEAIRQVVTKLPFNSPPTVITQHMPENFTEAFAKRLNTLTQVEVQEARDGQRLQSGNVYIAPGNRHMTLIKDGAYTKIKLDDGPNVSGHKPSVDVMFQSVAKLYGSNAIGAILTGMGKDGATGMLEMKEKGAFNIGQSQDTCVVYGMPKAATELKATNIELPLEKITAEILKHCS
jgi:two-component system chemotaxis response regulator CheB